MKKIFNLYLSIAMGLTVASIGSNSYAKDNYKSAPGEKCIISAYNNTFQGNGSYQVSGSVLDNTSVRKKYTGPITIKVTGCNTATVSLNNNISFDLVGAKPNGDGTGVIGSNKTGVYSYFRSFMSDKKDRMEVLIGAGSDLRFDAEMK